MAPAAASPRSVLDTRGEGGALGSVLLVGNGPSIRGRGLGSLIDSFDTVLRFNSFVTKGLEEHTGSKTSLWCHMMQWYHISTVEVRAARAHVCVLGLVHVRVCMLGPACVCVHGCVHVCTRARVAPPP